MAALSTSLKRVLVAFYVAMTIEIATKTFCVAKVLVILKMIILKSVIKK